MAVGGEGQGLGRSLMALPRSGLWVILQMPSLSGCPLPIPWGFPLPIICKVILQMKLLDKSPS